MRGGELIRCVHMADEPVVQYVVPRLELPVRAVFASHTLALTPELDTIVLEPHLGRATMTWRARTSLPRKPSQLREIWIGPAPAGQPIDIRDGRPVFARLRDALAWLTRETQEVDP